MAMGPGYNELLYGKHMLPRYTSDDSNFTFLQHSQVSTLGCSGMTVLENDGNKVCVFVARS